MNIFRSTLYGFLFAFCTGIPLANAADIEVEFVVRGEESIAVEGATVSAFVRNESTGIFEQYGSSVVSNGAGRADIMVPAGVTFFGKATKDSVVYAQSDKEWANIWEANADGSIHNPDSGSTRSYGYVHLYPGVDEEMITEPIAVSDPEPEEEFPDTVIPSGGMELEATVWDTHRNVLPGADVYIYLSNGTLYSGPVETGGAGRTDGLMIPIAQEFYAIGYDDDGTSYGGTYDTYYDRPNYWISNDGETIENTSTGQSSLPYLHLHPEERIALPTGYTGAPEAFDAASYECGDFPDAVYADISPEECEAIEYVRTAGIFTGTSLGTLDLNRPINRAEVTKVMVEAFDVPLLSDTSSVTQFPDVPQDTWFTSYVYTARDQEIVDGYPDGLFRPTNTINRVELLRIFIEASGASMSAIPTSYTFFHDIEVNDGTQWFIGYANFAFFNNLLDHDGSLRPSQPMTRLDVIRLLYRAEDF